jgi:AraC family transcriptional regulator of adaptative response / DNA-3-methyladenine glycosylase II
MMGTELHQPTPDVGLDEDACQRAVRARDPRFDGLFFVAITTTRIYCRPICPARVTYPDRRRFFRTAAEAERAGYRPCLRCRPELAPGRALCDAVSRLAYVAAHRIAAGALNGRSVAQLARELCVSERHLRRALERELGVSPIELAQTHRLLLAKRLLADTDLPVTRVAYASGFQSLRRFNAAFREHYRMPPSDLRSSQRASRTGNGRTAGEMLRVTLAYRAPFAWCELLAFLRRHASPGVELVEANRYARTIRIDGRTGVIVVEDAAHTVDRERLADGTSPRATHVTVDVSPDLVPVLMPLLARVRHFLDLDAEPAAIDAHLAEGGLAALVAQRPGLRIPGALDAFEAALDVLLHAGSVSPTAALFLARRIVATLGERVETDMPGLSWLAPGAERVAGAGAAKLEEAGVPRLRAHAITAVARAVADGAIRMDVGADVEATRRALMECAGIADSLATLIVLRTLRWPDTFPANDPVLQRAAGAPDAQALRARAERWRPWRGYAAQHLYAS